MGTSKLKHVLLSSAARNRQEADPAAPHADRSGSRRLRAASSWRSTSPTRWQNASGSSAASGCSATMRSTTPPVAQVEGADVLGAGHLGGVLDVAVHDRAGALGRERREPGVLGGDHPVGGEERQRAAAVALAEHQAQRRRRQGRKVGQAARDLAGEAALLRLGRQGGARGVDDGDERQAQLDRQPHAPPRLAQRARARAGWVLVWPRRSWPRKHAAGVAEPGERDQQPGVRLALAGAVEGDDVGGGVPQQSAYAGPVGAGATG